MDNKKKKLPLAGFQIKKKPAKEEQDDTLIKLYNESELSKKSDSKSTEKAETKTQAEAIADLAEGDDEPKALKRVLKSDKKSEKSAQKSAKKARKKREKLEADGGKVGRFFKRLIPAVTILGILGVLGFLLFRPFSTETISEEGASSTKPDEIYYSHLTGREVSKDKLNAAATCIMIENSPDARPQSSLDEAGVVYEAIAEGGITRFMAVFQEAKPQYIGPVRSLRMTYAEFAKPYQCSIAHVGGSPNALELVRGNSEYRDIDQFFNDDSYWRISSRWAPHNVYTSFNALDSLNQGKGYNTSEFNGFKRVQPDSTHETNPSPATNIHIEMSSGTYNPVYQYDAAANNYKRSFEWDGPHEVISEAGIVTQLAPDVVIALETDAVMRSGSAEGYADYRTTGEGTATIFQNGTVISAKWQRPDVNSELKFYDDSGTEIALNRGQVWITIYPSGNSVSWE